jgi:hypothetical protein
MGVMVVLAADAATAVVGVSAAVAVMAAVAVAVGVAVAVAVAVAVGVVVAVAVAVGLAVAVGEGVSVDVAVSVGASVAVGSGWKAEQPASMPTRVSSATDTPSEGLIRPECFMRDYSIVVDLCDVGRGRLDHEGAKGTKARNAKARCCMPCSPKTVHLVRFRCCRLSALRAIRFVISRFAPSRTFAHS